MKAGYVIMAFLSLAIAAFQFRFLFLPIDVASPDMVHHVAAIPFAFWLHVPSAALALGVAQFSARLRARRPALHRLTGRFYVAAVLAASMSGFALALNAHGGVVTQSGFALLSLAWAGATVTAFAHARARRLDQHRQWMTRSYALAFAAVTLRLQVPILVTTLHTDYTGVLPVIAWSCWLPNLIVAEWLIWRNPRFRPSAKPDIA